MKCQPEKKRERVQNSALTLLKGRGIVFNAFKSGIFSMPLKKNRNRIR